MMPLHALGIEFIVFALTALCLFDAFRRSWLDLSAMLGGVLFGLLIELYFVTQYSGYEYGEFLVAIKLQGGMVPFWVAAGWGSIVHICRRVTEGLEWWRAGAVAALLAVVLDASLDPVAQGLGWWTWSGRPGPYFGVPFDNFLGWIQIVGYYVLCLNVGTKLKPDPVWWRDLGLPLASVILSALAVAGGQLLADPLYGLIGEATTFLGVLAIVCTVAFVRMPTKTPSLPLIVAVALNVTVFVAAVATGLLAAQPILVMLLPALTALAIFAFRD